MNVMNVEEWFFQHNSSEDVANMHYILDKTLKYIHSKGYYVVDFSFKEILTNGESAQYNKVTSNDFKDKNKKNQDNVLMLTSLITKVYNGFPVNVPIQFLKDNFDEYKYVFVDGTEDYFAGVIKDGNVGYYSDYCDLKKSGDMKKSSQRSLTKSTPVGRMMTNDEAAYANVLILPAIITLLFISTVVIYFMFIYK